VHVLFQNDCRPFELTASAELQILRIAQEALANIRKHACAHTVRVLLTRRNDGAYMLLVEDDGVGFGSALTEGHRGKHIGLAIMEERARRIGADWRIESEPGEGTRMELVFEVERNSQGQASEDGDSRTTKSETTNYTVPFPLLRPLPDEDSGRLQGIGSV